eukprot:g5904.t1
MLRDLEAILPPMDSITRTHDFSDGDSDGTDVSSIGGASFASSLDTDWTGGGGGGGSSGAAYAFDLSTNGKATNIGRSSSGNSDDTWDIPGFPGSRRSQHGRRGGGGGGGGGSRPSSRASSSRSSPPGTPPRHLIAAHSGPARTASGRIPPAMTASSGGGNGGMPFYASAKDDILEAANEDGDADDDSDADSDADSGFGDESMSPGGRTPKKLPGGDGEDESKRAGGHRNNSGGGAGGRDEEDGGGSPPEPVAIAITRVAAGSGGTLVASKAAPATPTAPPPAVATAAAVSFSPQPVTEIIIPSSGAEAAVDDGAVALDFAFEGSESSRASTARGGSARGGAAAAGGDGGRMRRRSNSDDAWSHFEALHSQFKLGEEAVEEAHELLDAAEGAVRKARRMNLRGKWGLERVQQAEGTLRDASEELRQVYSQHMERLKVLADIANTTLPGALLLLPPRTDVLLREWDEDQALTSAGGGGGSGGGRRNGNGAAAPNGAGHEDGGTDTVAAPHGHPGHLGLVGLVGAGHGFGMTSEEFLELAEGLGQPLARLHAGHQVMAVPRPIAQHPQHPQHQPQLSAWWTARQGVDVSMTNANIAGGDAPSGVAPPPIQRPTDAATVFATGVTLMECALVGARVAIQCDFGRSTRALSGDATMDPVSRRRGSSSGGLEGTKELISIDFEGSDVGRCPTKQTDNVSEEAIRLPAWESRRSSAGYATAEWVADAVAEAENNAKTSRNGGDGDGGGGGGGGGNFDGAAGALTADEIAAMLPAELQPARHEIRARCGVHAGILVGGHDIQVTTELPVIWTFWRHTVRARAGRAERDYPELFAGGGGYDSPSGEDAADGGVGGGSSVADVTASSWADVQAASHTSASEAADGDAHPLDEAVKDALALADVAAAFLSSDTTHVSMRLGMAVTVEKQEGLRVSLVDAIAMAPLVEFGLAGLQTLDDFEERGLEATRRSSMMAGAGFT